jgi:hypothetical protein
LHVGGRGLFTNDLTTTNKLISLTTTEAPIQVSSGTLVSNLNVDLVDGFNATNASPWFNRIPVVGNQGSLNIGRYIEFHTTTASNTTFTIDNPSNGVLTFSGSITATGLTGSLANGVTAGNGLTGGTFNNSGNITFAVGTPSNITSTSTNSVTATSHTHTLANDAVTTAKIENNAVTTVKIADNSITAAKLSSTGTAGNPPVFGVRAYGRMSGGTSATPNVAYGRNIASITKTGSGSSSLYRVNFTNSMPNLQYVVLMTIDSGEDHVCQVVTREVGYFTFNVFDPGQGNGVRTQTDSVLFSVVC